MSDMTKTRPGSVTTVVVLTWIVAVLDILGGIAFLGLSRSDAFKDALELSSGDTLWWGLGTLIIGIITAIVAIGLSVGARGARTLVTIVMVARLAFFVYVLIAIGLGGLAGAGLSIISALLILGLLYNKRSNEYFAR